MFISVPPVEMTEAVRGLSLPFFLVSLRPGFWYNPGCSVDQAVLGT